jgi:excinuclease ABC subunit C
VLAACLEFVAERAEDFFASIPAAPAVFLIAGAEGSEPYVSKSANLRRRLIRLLGATDERTKRLNLRERARLVEYTLTGSDFESGFLLYRALRDVFPKTYSTRLRLRFAPLVKLHLENEFPRASVTTRMGRAERGSAYYGPFPSRSAAEKFANDSLDFFKMRRCVEDLKPDPAFPGCIYSEMKMCLAPCFKGCSDEEYRVEVARVKAYFDTGGESLLRQLADEREQASANLEFENAAAAHAKIEKLKPVLSQYPEIVHRIDRLSAVMIQPSSQRESVALFRVDGGRISGPRAFSIQQEIVPGGKSASMESRVLEAISDIPTPSTGSALETMEHLALLKRWYYRSQRLGEIFFADERGTLPPRRIVRGISRVYRGEKAEPEPLPFSGASEDGQAPTQNKTENV